MSGRGVGTVPLGPGDRPAARLGLVLRAAAAVDAAAAALHDTFEVQRRVGQARVAR